MYICLHLFSIIIKLSFCGILQDDKWDISGLPNGTEAYIFGVYRLCYFRDGYLLICKMVVVFVNYQRGRFLNCYQFGIIELL